ncbi:hypothetical protein ACFYU9_11345 [Streptomyces sp. NPDC004327]|uniref:hypothetical protein n=1 Tax=Streptomyces sp. NPDC004327 TaxID=3364699 RepID=UPI0036B8F941
MPRFRTAALTAAALLAAAAVPGAIPVAVAVAAAAPATVTQEPGHPAVMFPGRQVTVAAYCPEGMTPSGGGATVESDPESAVFLKDTFPDGQRWVVRAVNYSDEVQTLHPRVICTTDSVTTQVSPDVPLRPGESRSAPAYCDDNTFVVGGGGQGGDVTFLSGTLVYTVHGWQAKAKYTNGDPAAPPSFLRTKALCSRTQPTYGFSDTVRLDAGKVGTAHVECPPGLVPSGGGGSGGTDVLFNASAPTASGWTVRATNTGSAQGTLYASVVCTAP